jgi:hypothetical protein
LLAQEESGTIRGKRRIPVDARPGLPFNGGVQIVPMTRAYATEVVTWRYPAPYDCYDMTDADSAFLSSPDSGFFARASADGRSYEILTRPA